MGLKIKFDPDAPTQDHEHYHFNLMFFNKLISITGQTANTIQQHEEYVKTLWADLKRKSSRKQHKLNDSIAYHKLNVAVSIRINVYNDYKFI